MSYSKLQKVIQDFALGYQTVNQARDNADQQLTDLGVKHGRNLAQNAIASGTLPTRPAGISSGYPWQDFGRHNDLLIPRGVARVEVASTNLGVSWWFQTNSPSVIISAARLTVGCYYFLTAGCGKNQWGDVACSTDGTTPRTFDCRYLALGGVEGLLVQIYSLDAGSFTVDDFSFSLRVRSTNA